MKVRVSTGAMLKAKAHVDLRTMFFKYISSKKKTRENVGLLMNGVDALVTKDTEKAELLNAFFVSVLTAKASGILGPGHKGEILEKERLSPGRGVLD